MVGFHVLRLFDDFREDFLAEHASVVLRPWLPLGGVVMRLFLHRPELRDDSIALRKGLDFRCAVAGWSVFGWDFRPLGFLIAVSSVLWQWWQ